MRILASVMRPDPTVRMKTAAQPTAPASVGVAMPARITPSVARMTTITGSTPISNSRTTGPKEAGRSSKGSAGPRLGLIQQRIRHHSANKVANKTPGTSAAANKSVAGTPTTGPITISMTDGGIRIPKVPPAVMAPALNRASYPLLIIEGAAMTPSKVTDEPTMPVAAAKMVAVIRTARYSEPRIPASNCCRLVNIRSIRPDCSNIKPMNKKNGIEARTVSFITEKVCKTARSNTMGPKAINPVVSATQPRVNAIGKPIKIAAKSTPKASKPMTSLLMSSPPQLWTRCDPATLR